MRSASMAAAWLVISMAACSERGGDVPPEPGRDSGRVGMDGGGAGDAGGGGGDSGGSIYDATTRSDAECEGMGGGTCTPIAPGCGAEACDDGLDGDCDGQVDEDCACVPGTVQDCFLGPPGSRRVGGCRDGSQRCVGSFEFGTWGACEGGISPVPETCNALDDDCNGCPDEGGCCDPEISCPAPGDVRIADGRPFETYPLHGADFFPGAATAWRWTVRGGPCDELLPRPTFTVSGDRTSEASFTPTLSGDYTVVMEVTTASGEVLTCTFVVHIAGPGLRVELCWDTSTTVDLDLYVHDPRNTGPWFDGTGSPLSTVNENACSWANCEATLRAGLPRADWGYARSAVTECDRGPHGPEWRRLGYCSNPRLDIDNNLIKTSGSPENTNVDVPRDGESFRVMVENYDGGAARPMVNVYCGGHLRATLGAPPDDIADFTGPHSGLTLGAMWRAADVRVAVDAAGTTTDCAVTPLHPPGEVMGHWVTRGDPSY